MKFLKFIYHVLFLLACITNIKAAEKVIETVKEFDSGVSHIERIYQDWNTTKIVDDLEPNFKIIICSRYIVEKYDNGRSRLCFRFYSPDVVLVEPQAISGKGFWPHCDYDRITYKVDSGDPDYIPMLKKRGGSCGDYLDTSKFEFIHQLKNGSKIKLKIYLKRGVVSLNGFSEAFNYAVNEFEIITSNDNIKTLKIQRNQLLMKLKKIEKLYER